MAYNGNGFGSGGYGGNSFKTMNKTTCSECKKECEVPFKPREGRPTYCRECFSKRKNASR